MPYIATGELQALRVAAGGLEDIKTSLQAQIRDLFLAAEGALRANRDAARRYAQEAEALRLAARTAGLSPMPNHFCALHSTAEEQAAAWERTTARLLREG